MDKQKRTGAKENCYFGLQVSVPNPRCATYASTCP